MLSKTHKPTRKLTKLTKQPSKQQLKKHTKTKKIIKPLSQLLSPQRQFATRQHDGESHQGDDSGGNDATEDPVILLQRKVMKQKKQIEDLQRQLTDTKTIMEEWQTKARQLQDRVKLEIEEQHNIHDRYKREISDVKKYSVGRFSKTIIEGVDALEAASKATDVALQRSQDENLVKLGEGLSMTTALFHKALSNEGIRKFNSLGLMVDPNLHFITAQLPSPHHSAGTITHILKEGYHIHDRVLRPAQVIVAHNPDSV